MHSHDHPKTADNPLKLKVSGKAAPCKKCIELPETAKGHNMPASECLRIENPALRWLGYGVPQSLLTSLDRR